MKNKGDIEMGLHPMIAAGLEQRKMELIGKCEELYNLASFLVKKLGVKKSNQKMTDYYLFFKHDSSRCKLFGTNFGPDHDFIEIEVDDVRVLKLTLKNSGPSEDERLDESQLIFEVGGKWYFVTRYVPGVWESWLDYEEIKKSIYAEKAKIEKADLAKRNKKQKKVSLSEKEIMIAERFGIKV